MTFSKELLQLQFDFAEHISRLNGKTIKECLLHYTSFYKIFIPDWDFNHSNPLWVKFLKEFKKSGYKVEILKDFYSDRESVGIDRYGCFSYHYNEEQKTIYIHFKNIGESEGVLSKSRMDTRVQELKEMFSVIKQKYHEVDYVSGFSWLYNIEAYNRLFPSEYIKTAKKVRGWFKSLALWGQFLNNDGQIKNKIFEEFHSKLKDLKSVKDIDEVFPYMVLQPKANIRYFYKFLNI